MRLVRSELQVRAKATLGWVVGIVALVLMIMAFYPAVKKLPSLDAIYSNLPRAFQGLLGGADLVSPAGYLRTQLFAFFLPAVLLILGMGRGASTLAGEEEDRTLDLLLAQPVSRVRLYVEKAIAIVVWLAMATAATLVPLVALNSVTGLHLPIVNLAASCVQMGLMCAAASLACQAVASATGRRIVGIGAVGYYMFLSYLVFGLSTAVSWLGSLRPFTLWRWYLGNDPLTHGFDLASLLVLCAVSVALTAIGAVAFTRRDLHA